MPSGREAVPLRDSARGAPSPAQLDLRPSDPREPVPVRVWVLTGSGHHEVDGWAVAWTARTVEIRYIDQHGREGRAWVWATAVTRAGVARS